ncbi:MAG: ferritin-like domain-containing protein [Hyphomicrobiales bacterium]
MRWTLDDIDWQAFDAAKVDPELLKAVKAAALVEYNAPDYVAYLQGVFGPGSDTLAHFEQWGREEAQHGKALARWARMADPAFDFDDAMARFRALQNIDTQATQSRRGSRAGEMVARCVVESGTSSFYTAIKDHTGEPCLKQIATYLAADEFAHYRLFLEILRAHANTDPISIAGRLKIAVARAAEADDDELAGAYFCANHQPGDGVVYERQRFTRAYLVRALGIYREQHIHRLVSMVLKAGGLNPRGWFSQTMCWAVWRIWQWRLAGLRRAAV